MGNPRRFYGTGEPILLAEGGSIPARCAVEVTFRTYERRFLMRPSRAVNRIILGCLGRAKRRYPTLALHVVSFLSNHGSLVCTPPNPFVLWSFMRDFMSTTARRLNGHHGRVGTFWERRYRAIPIVDEESLERCFAYCLLQGTKENLVWSARDWPGISSVKALCEGVPLIGQWRDQAREYELRRQRQRRLDRAAVRGRTLRLPEVEDVVVECPIELAPLPHWRKVRPAERRARVEAIVRADETAQRARHRRDGTAPLGVAGIATTDPFARPAVSKCSPAPRCHARTPALRDGFLEACRQHDTRTREVTAAVERTLPKLGLPVGSSLAPLVHRPEVEPRKSAAAARIRVLDSTSKRRRARGRPRLT
ncbi:MAG: hypothetical protein H6709_16595 [Kofleriaceae bacterium]|nr:hypothetical protein [Myxococcales bacterium]MCB9561750.1 hypothetical protein [Kofleriaceae bacterium]MCB9573701.1 hypothetical protein [Kofleriaceae bacterium]